MSRAGSRFRRQLPELFDVVRLHPDLRFTVAVMGWPLDLTAGGRARWRDAMVTLAGSRTCTSTISAVECVLGGV